MPQFIIERDMLGASAMTEDQIREGSLRALDAIKELGTGVRWLHSFVTDDKIYCIYYAPDEETIRKHGAMTGFPVNRVSAVRRLVDPDSFK